MWRPLISTLLALGLLSTQAYAASPLLSQCFDSTFPNVYKDRFAIAEKLVEKYQADKKEKLKEQLGSQSAENIDVSDSVLLDYTLSVLGCEIEGKRGIQVKVEIKQDIQRVDLSSIN